MESFCAEFQPFLIPPLYRIEDSFHDTPTLLLILPRACGFRQVNRLLLLHLEGVLPLLNQIASCGNFFLSFWYQHDSSSNRPTFLKIIAFDSNG